MKHKKIQVPRKKKAAICITRYAHKSDKAVYIACANKPIQYKKGESKIIYIGKTKKGAKRVANSAARKSKDLLKIHGLRYINFYVIPCKKIQGLDTRSKVEGALIETFNKLFKELPKGNKIRGVKFDPKYFKAVHLENVITHYSTVESNISFE